MAYTNFDDSGNTQTADERSAEAERILRRLGPWLQARGDDARPVRGWTPAAERFVLELFSGLELIGRIEVTAKQLWWLRDLNDAAD